MDIVIEVTTLHIAHIGWYSKLWCCIKCEKWDQHIPNNMAASSFMLYYIINYKKKSPYLVIYLIISFSKFNERDCVLYFAFRFVTLAYFPICLIPAPVPPPPVLDLAYSETPHQFFYFYEWAKCPLNPPSPAHLRGGLLATCLLIDWHWTLNADMNYLSGSAICVKFDSCVSSCDDAVTRGIVDSWVVIRSDLIEFSLTHFYTLQSPGVPSLDC